MATKIAILSGKGGTGKTLVSVNLATIANNSTYIDCDVEEPNGHLFFKDCQNKEDVIVMIPEVDNNKCNGCKRCVNFCKFHALVLVNNTVKVFDDLCHSCGGCALLCPNQAISETEKVIGEIQTGRYKNVNVVSGFLKPGIPSGVPIISQVLSKEYDNEYIFIDCPPGSSCSVMESIKDADYCLLVTEPTVFGIHNLNMVCELMKLFDKPFGVIINKSIEEEQIADNYCINNNINIIGRIPYDSYLGEINSKGEIATTLSNKYKQLFKEIFENVSERINNETITNS